MFTKLQMLFNFRSDPMTEALNAFSMYNSPRSGFGTNRRDKELGPSITPGCEGADTFGRT